MKGCFFLLVVVNGWMAAECYPQESFSRDQIREILSNDVHEIVVIDAVLTSVVKDNDREMISVALTSKRRGTRLHAADAVLAAPASDSELHLLIPAMESPEVWELSLGNNGPVKTYAEIFSMILLRHGIYVSPEELFDDRVRARLVREIEPAEHMARAQSGIPKSNPARATVAKPAPKSEPRLNSAADRNADEFPKWTRGWIMAIAILGGSLVLLLLKLFGTPR